MISCSALYFSICLLWYSMIFSTFLSKNKHFHWFQCLYHFITHCSEFTPIHSGFASIYSGFISIHKKTNYNSYASVASSFLYSLFSIHIHTQEHHKLQCFQCFHYLITHCSAFTSIHSAFTSIHSTFTSYTFNIHIHTQEQKNQLLCLQHLHHFNTHKYIKQKSNTHFAVGILPGDSTSETIALMEDSLMVLGALLSNR